MRLWQQAEDEAVRVFAANLRDLLLAAPAGARPTMGLDPGLRTGVKVTVVDGTGRPVATTASTRTSPGGSGTPRSPCWPGWQGSTGRAGRDRQRHRLAGDRQARRRPDRRQPELRLTKVMVSEAGASVYSATAYAARNCPAWTSRCAARCPSPGACRIRWPSWSRSTAVDRGRAVPARRVTGQAVQVAGRCGGGLRERGRRRREHGVGAAAGPGLRHRRGSGRRDRRAPGRQRAVPQPPGTEAGAAARAQGVRAVRRVPQDRGRRRSPRCLRRAPRGVPGGAQDAGGDRPSGP